MGYKLMGKGRKEIEIEEELNKGNPFSSDMCCY